MSVYRALACERVGRDGMQVHLKQHKEERKDKTLYHMQTKEVKGKSMKDNLRGLSFWFVGSRRPKPGKGG
ncbi:hypothetical protein GCM10018966_025930 [Streptomyces yanii]